MSSLILLLVRIDSNWIMT